MFDLPVLSKQCFKYHYLFVEKYLGEVILLPDAPMNMSRVSINYKVINQTPQRFNQSSVLSVCHDAGPDPERVRILTLCKWPIHYCLVPSQLSLIDLRQYKIESQGGLCPIVASRD